MAFFSFIFDTFLGKAVACALALSAFLGWFAWDQRSKGAAHVVVTINEGAKKIAAEGRKARVAAERPGAAQRLLEHSCRDC